MLGPNILPKTVFSNSLSQPSSRSVRDQVYYLYKNNIQDYISVYLNL